MLISRFSKKITPFSGSKTRIIKSTSIDTPIGLMHAAAIEEGICLLDFADRDNLEIQINKLQETFNAIVEYGENDHLTDLKTQLDEYFTQQRKVFALRLIFSGTDFQNKCWKLLQNIPYGETCTYTQQALNLGNRKAVRAVASANANNRIAIIVPCHRVIAASGNLSGYAGGLWRKEFLLRLEQAI
jgi:AraC family transcriptional regulator of adaptative response/methylated-DNA-[protein]-cysteine methyltransferase